MLTRVIDRSWRRSVVAAAVATGIACGPSGPPPTQEAAAERPAQALALATATTEDVSASFEAGGVVRARTTATVAARVMAPVVSVSAREGERVRRGATLVTLDARDLTAQAARARASLAAADQSVRAAEAQVTAAEAGLRLARSTHERIVGLHEKKSATSQELDQAVAGLRAAEAQVSGARAQVAAAAAARDAARAGLEAADVSLSYAVLTAPFDGVVATRTTDPGSLAVPGAPLLVLEQTDALRLEASLDEARAGAVTVGQEVDVRVDGDDAWAPGRVSEVGRLDPSTHSLLVKIDLPSGAARRTGSFGRARFAARSRRALTVPATAVVRRGQLAFVFKVGPDRQARLRPVTPGPAAGDRMEILAGLSEGDAVVLAPAPTLEDGTPVTAASARTEAGAGR
jgi:multidrug efflux pump subunit AcrA (membrane-fusion protein)